MRKFILFLSLLFVFGITQFAQEKIENEGAITIDTASTLVPNAGTVEFRSGEFRGYDGSNWKKLDNPAYVPPAPSFAYAWLSDTLKIPVNQWTKIRFDQVQFDINGEFMRAPGSSYSDGSFFPNEPGFYQVTARCEYEVVDYEFALNEAGGLIPFLEPRSYVSIAVFTGVPNPDNPSPHDDHMYSQGNNLQIAFGTDDNGAQGLPLNRNNAPNVSTIVEVEPEQSISIYGFWYQPSGRPGTGGMPLQVAHDPGGGGYAEESPDPETAGPIRGIPDKSKVYVTIHKVFP